jgi:hypothetical protein
MKGMAMIESKITVNGRAVAVSVPHVTYGDAVDLAGFHGFPGKLRVTWTRGDESGMLSKGRAVRVEDGMTFTVADTSFT